MTLVDVAHLPAGRLLGVDLGEVRLGFAITDPGQTIATPAGTVLVPAGASAADVAVLITREVADRAASGAVVGNPRRLDGREGRASARARAVAEVLARDGLSVALVDERLTTVEAARVMRDQNIDARRGREDVDQVAAAVILQRALDERRPR